MIYIVRHKAYNTPVMDGYRDLEVGPIYKGFNSENAFNQYLNETTAMFDILSTGDDIVGLVHYHRFFKGLTFNKAKEILKDYEIITTPDYSPETPYKHLINSLDKNLVDKYLKQLPEDVQTWFNTHQSFNICNMFVSRRDVLKSYLEFIKPVSTMTKQFIKEDLSTNEWNNRTLGFICECLFGYFCKDLKKYKNEIEVL